MLSQTVLFSVLAGLAAAAPAKRWPWGSFLGANFFQTNGLSGNQLVTSYILPDGSLQAGSAVWTNGKGSASINDPNPEENHGDPLLGGGSVMVLGSQVFVVNAGSNTFSVFDIDTTDPGTPTWNACYDSVYEWPQSLAASPNGQMVCVLSGGAQNGFACYGQGQNGWEHWSQWDRSFGLNVTTPPHGPVGGTPSQMVFAQDFSGIMVAIKGRMPTDLNNPTGVFQPGALYWYPITNGTLAENATQITANAPFSIQEDWQNPGAFFMSDVTTGYATYDLYSNATSVTQGTIVGQNASCWAAQDPRSGDFYVVATAANGTVYDVDVDWQTLNGTVVGSQDTGPASTATDISIFEGNAYDWMYLNAADYGSVHVYKVWGPGNWEFFQKYDASSWPAGVASGYTVAGQANWYATY